MRTPFSTAPLRFLLLGSFLLAEGCGDGAPGVPGPGTKDPAGRSLYLQSSTPGGRVAFVTRIDGDILDTARFSLWGEEDQTVAVTGQCPGEDQRKVLVYAPDGTPLADWRPSGENPYGLLQFQHPVPRTLQPLHIGDRRFFSLFTAGIFFPASLVLVEAEPGHRLTERLILWNPGALNEYAVEGENLAFTGLNNRLQMGPGGLEPRSDGARYHVGVGIASISSLPREAGAVRRIQIPAATAERGTGFRFYYLLPVIDGTGDSQGSLIRVVGDEVRTSFATGLTFVAHLRTGSHRFEASDGYRAAFRKRAKPGDPTLEESLRAMEASVHVWTGERP